jgi:hypothetical protein
MTSLAQIRAGFILKGTTFKAWCRERGIDPGYAHRIASGKTAGPKANEMRAEMMEASRATVEKDSHD